MKIRPNALCAAAVLALVPVAAQAAITCTTLTSTTFATNYALNNSVALQQTLTLSCTRSSTSDASSVSFSVTANNGSNDPGNSGKNRAKLDNANIAYEFRSGSCGGPVWSNNGTPLTGTVTWPAGVTGAASSSITYWACIAPQSPNNAGFYTDSVALTASWVTSPSGGSGIVPGTAGVSIFAPASCAFPVGGAPGNISLTYNSFSATPVSGSTPFNISCSSGMQYTMDVSPASGTLAGVAYTIAPNQASSTGTGVAQTLGITATAAAGQPGTCAGASCTASQAHVLTITY